MPIDFAAIARRAEFERRKLRKMIDYAYSPMCLRRFILEYFGESRRLHSCHNCSVCLESSEPLVIRPLDEEETIVVKKVLSCVARMKGQFGAKRIAEVLTGSKAKALEQWGLTSLSTYGILRNMSQNDVMEVVRTLVEAGYLEIEGSVYPVIQLTEQGRAAMTGKIPVEMAFPLTLAGRKEEASAVAGKAVADFPKNPSASPPSRQSQRGTESDALPKPASPTAEATWHLWKRGKTLDEIAAARGFTPGTIVRHLLQLMAEGRPIDIGRIVSPERRAIIEEAIARAGSDRLKPIKDLLPEDVSYDEIRLVAAATIQSIFRRKTVAG
jgi:ATP-dependent DNA helicase RecQ